MNETRFKPITCQHNIILFVLYHIINVAAVSISFPRKAKGQNIRIQSRTLKCLV